MKKELDVLIATYRDLQPFASECLKKLNQKFRLEFNFNSNHLEGNTLSYGETKLLLIFDQTKGNHEMREFEEMKAHDIALLKIKEEAADKERPLTERFIKELNELILVRPYWKEAETADGQATRRLLQIGTYKEQPNHVRLTNGEIFEYASPQETPILMAELVQWYNDEIVKNEFSAIELAAILHYRYIRIHPFDDGNGRVARLLVNYVLYYNDLPPIIIKSAEKEDYLRALRQADAGDLPAFIDYMTSQLAWSLDLSIRAAKGENIEEQDDWEKKLSLMKKELGEKKEVVKRSDESIKILFEKVVTPLFELFDQKISQFYSFFIDANPRLNLSGFYVQVKPLTELMDALDDSDLISNILRGRSFLIFYQFDQLCVPLRRIKIDSCSVSFLFEENTYSIRVGDRLTIEKLYNDYLSEDEMNEIVSLVAKDILQKIEEIKKN